MEKEKVNKRKEIYDYLRIHENNTLCIILSILAVGAIILIITSQLRSLGVFFLLLYPLFMIASLKANAKLKGKLKGETDETIDIMYEDAQNGMSLDEYVAIIGKEYIFGAETRDYCRIDDIARIYKVVCYRRQGGVRSVSKILLYAELKSGEKVFLANLDINGGADGQMLMITTAVLDKNPRAIIDC
ncbi:MAG: hypothetical protein MJ133_03190 [Lachnospiraceae bacterium]|nr:hypothetical protein [Lachnospiraceae bacterium]